MSKRCKLIIAAMIIAICLCTLNIYGSWAVENNPVDLLFPENLRYQVYFQGEFTPDILSYLVKLTPATALNTLNVLRGSNGDLMLDRTANRMEAAAMLVRLLGAEQEALSTDCDYPFTDVASWASPYIGYLYQNALTNGVGKNMYGSERAVDEKSYLTFLLRALGYTDKDGQDFTWDTVEQTALKAGILKPGEKINDGIPFTRARLSELSWRTMFVDHKLHNQYLIVFLYNKGMFSGESVEMLLEGQGRPLANQWLLNLAEVENAFLEHESDMEFTLNEEMVNNEFQKHIGYILERVQLSTGVFYKGYSSELWQKENEYVLYIKPRYVNTLEQDQSLFAAVDEINSIILEPGMTDYEKEKAVHDFLIQTLKYDTSSKIIDEIPESSFHALGALQTGTAVCQGYSELMMLLLNRAGIPCRMVIGEADGSSHSWNMVLLNGGPYHVDVTWDDPVTENGKDSLCYDYFNLTDNEIKQEHIWLYENYPPCTAIEENYFYKNNLVINSEAMFIQALKEAVKSRETDIYLKLQDIDAENLDIVKIIYDINDELGYTVQSFIDSSKKEIQVIRLESIKYAK